MKKIRIDGYLIENKLAADKDAAFVLVTEGSVFVDGHKAVSPAQLVGPRADIKVRTQKKYVGRGAEKLAAALEAFDVSVERKVCVDIGAATGGFTEVLLERGAAKVYAIDTARGKFADKLRRDPRVILMEGQDIRDLVALPEAADCITIDVSLIFLRNILPAAFRFLSREGFVVALFKPQYETRDPAVLRHGIIRSDSLREELFRDFTDWAAHSGWNVLQSMVSPIRGSKGNTEYLVLLSHKIS